jgi:hypothetical protein
LNEWKGDRVKPNLTLVAATIVLVASSSLVPSAGAAPPATQSEAKATT